MISRTSAARHDLVWVVLVTLGTAGVCVRFDLSESLMGWARRHERWQADELPGILLVLAVCLIWFSSRRYFETRRELGLRSVIQSELTEALAENQRLAQQYVDMQEYERKAIARDLHDELGQYLNVIKLDAVAIRDAPPANDGRIVSSARALIENVDRVYAVVAGLIRQLRPAGLDELGVLAALEHCVQEWRARLPATRIEMTIETAVDSLAESRALALFRLVQEALNNVARHSGATQVQVRIGRHRDPRSQEFIDVAVSDNGRGMDVAAPRTGLGLVGMRERAAACGGTFALSSNPGQGVTISASLPVLASAADGVA